MIKYIKYLLVFLLATDKELAVDSAYSLVSVC